MTLSVTGAWAAGGHEHGGTYVSKSGNVIERVSADVSPYVPDVAGASASDRALAQKLLNGVNGFCRSYTAADIRRSWDPNEGNPKASHWHNPNGDKDAVNPAAPRSVVLLKDDVQGLLFYTWELPYLGSIPRPHSHEAGSMQMLHVWCASDLKTAFTPSRELAGLPTQWNPNGGGGGGGSHAGHGGTTPTVRPTSPKPSSKLTPTTPPDTGTADRAALRAQITRNLGRLSESELQQVLTMVES